MPKPLPEQPHPAGQRPDPLADAARAAVEATDNSQQLALIAAYLQGQQIAQAGQPQPCRHPPVARRPWGPIIALGCFGLIALAIVAVVLVALFVGLSIAVVCLTICTLILYGIWRDIRSKKGPA